MSRMGLLIGLAVVLAIGSPTVSAGGGYFVMGYGPYAHQTAGTSAAMGLDGFAGSSNPAKLAFTEERLDLDLLAFMPYRRIERRDSGTPFDFRTQSRNSFFLLPEAGYVKRINPRWSWGVTLYGNGGLNSEYPGNTGVPGTNANPAKCGNAPGNFFAGCGNLGFDLSQVIIAPSISWQFEPGYSLGISPLFAYQQFKAFGLQAFEALSQAPNNVSSLGYDTSIGAGFRVGWMARPKPWLDLGLAYTSRVHMSRFDRYRGLIANRGDFDIPPQIAVGFAVRPVPRWEVGFDVHRVFYGDVAALTNGVLNSINDPAGSPLGSKTGSGFNWRHRNTFRGGVAWAASERWTLRAGYAYGRRPWADSSANSISFSTLTPNPVRQVTIGTSYTYAGGHEFHFAYGLYVEKTYGGPSATTALGVGGTESVTPHVDTVMLGWTKRW